MRGVIIAADQSVMSSFMLPINLGRPINRITPDEIPSFVQAEEWQAFCDAFDRLSLNPIDRHGSVMMRLSLIIAIICLVAVILFGYLNLDDGNKDGGNDGDKDGDGGVSTLLVLLTAIPIAFPFVMAAVLNCHNASTVAKIIQLCRTNCEEWASKKGVDVKVEQLQSVSNEDEVIDKILIQFNPRSTKGHEESDGTPASCSSGTIQSDSTPQEKDYGFVEPDV